jgi:aryl-phospho-beta-D-glucosidase BglC (GH1 family)
MNDFITIEDRHYTLNGEKFIPKGINLGNWLHIEHYMHGFPSVENDMHAQMKSILGEEKTRRYWKLYRDCYIQEKDFKLISEMGFNCVRVPLNVNMFEEGSTFGEEVFHYLDRAFAWARKHGIYIQLDLHALPGGQARDHNADPFYGIVPAFWHHESFRNKALKTLSVLAERYEGESHLWGYSPACEPNTEEIGLLNEYYRKSIEAIRTYDKDHIILLEPNHWARDISSLSTDLFDDPQVTYQVHLYFFFHSDIMAMDDYPSVNGSYLFNRSNLEKMIFDCMDKTRIQRPVTMGEFGVIWEESMFYKPDKEKKESLIMAKASADIRKIMEEDGGGWCLWAYKDLGVIGTTYSKEESAWRKFLARPEIRERYSWLNRGFTPNFSEYDNRTLPFQHELATAFPYESKDGTASTILALRRSVETLLLRHVLFEMDKLPEEDFEACATSFDLDHCDIREEVVKIILNN